MHLLVSASLSGVSHWCIGACTGHINDTYICMCIRMQHICMHAYVQRLLYLSILMFKMDFQFLRLHPVSVETFKGICASSLTATLELFLFSGYTACRDRLPSFNLPLPSCTSIYPYSTLWGVCTYLHWNVGSQESSCMAGRLSQYIEYSDFDSALLPIFLQTSGLMSRFICRTLLLADQFLSVARFWLCTTNFPPSLFMQFSSKAYKPTNSS